MLSYIDWFRSPPASVQGLLQPSGAMTLAACLAVQEQHGVTGSLAEIGAFAGKTLIGLASASRDGERVVAVDPFEVNGIKFRYHFDYNVSHHLPEQVRDRLRIKACGSEKITPDEWAEALGSPARLVHIDGDHTAPAVRHDLDLAVNHLASNGLVVIDDIFNETCPDLTAGIIDALRSLPQIRPFALIPRLGPHQEGGAKLFCEARCGALSDQYVAAMTGELTDLRPTTREFIGSEITIFFQPMNSNR